MAVIGACANICAGIWIHASIYILAAQKRRMLVGDRAASKEDPPTTISESRARARRKEKKRDLSSRISLACSRNIAIMIRPRSIQRKDLLLLPFFFPFVWISTCCRSSAHGKRKGRSYRAFECRMSVDMGRDRRDGQQQAGGRERRYALISSSSAGGEQRRAAAAAP